MDRTIILLTGDIEAPHLTEVLRDTGALVEVVHVADLAALKAAVAALRPGDAPVLVAYCTNVIVPGDVLGAFDGWAYNFHPGPPTYPGIFPAHFAAYESAQEFGVTAHVMTEKVDDGPIIDVQTFPAPPGADAQTLEEMAYVQLFTLFRRLADALASSKEKLKAIDVAWSGPPRTKKELAAIRRENPDL